jgi:hypothetical protein
MDYELNISQSTVVRAFDFARFSFAIFLSRPLVSTRSPTRSLNNQRENRTLSVEKELRFNGASSLVRTGQGFGRCFIRVGPRFGYWVFRKQEVSGASP